MRKTKTFVTFLTGLSVAVLVAAATARAEDQPVKLGVSISTTGQGAALGIPERNTLSLYPEEIGGAKIEIIQLDDAGDPTAATTNARRLATDDKVDVLIGSSITPPSIAMANVAAEVGVPHFALAPMPVSPTTAKWSVVMPQPVSLMAKALYEHMKKNGVKTVGLIGFSDSWGDLWVNDFKKNAEPMGLKLVADERYGRADTSVAGQALKLVAAKPDAVLVAGSGTAAALPPIALRDRGYKGSIYQTHGAVTKDFIRIGGKAVEGNILASGPVVVAELQPEGAPTKKPGMAYVQAYEPKYGKDTRTQFGAHMWDVLQVLERVIPQALKKAKPGTQEFRDAIREALTSEKDIAASQAVYNWTDKDRYGVDQRAVVLLTVKDGDWELIK
ncbi:MAG: ABC transporter substrate-binding protein [Xanthobacteraceae bacterium]